MTVRLIVEETYRRGLKALPPDRCKAANAALVKCIKDPSLPGLKFRLLQGTSQPFHYQPE